MINEYPNGWSQQYKVLQQQHYIDTEHISLDVLEPDELAFVVVAATYWQDVEKEDY